MGRKKKTSPQSLKDRLVDKTATHAAVLAELYSLRSAEDSNMALSTASDIQAANERLKMILDYGIDQDSGLELATNILRALPSPIPHEMARWFVEAKFIDTLAEFCNTLTQNKVVEGNVDEAMEVLLQCVQDVCHCTYRGTADRKIVQGKNVCGPYFIEKIIAAFKTRGASMCVAAARQTATTLLDLITHSKPNQNTLSNARAGFRTLIENYLPVCGDYSIQVDVMEILYRCCKTGALGQEKDALPPKARAHFQDLLRKSTKGLDLGTELRGVISCYNDSLGEKASVHSFQARSLAVHSDVIGMRCTCKWIDLGENHMSIYVSMEGDGDDVPPDVMDIFQDNIASISVQNHTEDSLREMTITCKSLPSLLSDQAPPLRDAQRGLSVKCTLSMDDLEKVKQLMPEVRSLLRGTRRRTPKISCAISAHAAAKKRPLSVHPQNRCSTAGNAINGQDEHDKENCPNDENLTPNAIMDFGAGSKTGSPKETPLAALNDEFIRCLTGCAEKKSPIKTSGNDSEWPGPSNNGSSFKRGALAERSENLSLESKFKERGGEVQTYGKRKKDEEIADLAKSSDQKSTNETLKTGAGSDMRKYRHNVLQPQPLNIHTESKNDREKVPTPPPAKSSPKSSEECPSKPPSQERDIRSYFKKTKELENGNNGTPETRGGGSRVWSDRKRPSLAAYLHPSATLMKDAGKINRVKGSKIPSAYRSPPVPRVSVYPDTPSDESDKEECPNQTPVLKGTGKIDESKERSAGDICDDMKIGMQEKENGNGLVGVNKGKLTKVGKQSNVDAYEFNEDTPIKSETKKKNSKGKRGKRNKAVSKTTKKTEGPCEEPEGGAKKRKAPGDKQLCETNGKQGVSKLAKKRMDTGDFTEKGGEGAPNGSSFAFKTGSNGEGNAEKNGIRCVRDQDAGLTKRRGGKRGKKGETDDLMESGSSGGINSTEQKKDGKESSSSSKVAGRKKDGAVLPAGVGRTGVRGKGRGKAEASSMLNRRGNDDDTDTEEGSENGQRSIRRGASRREPEQGGFATPQHKPGNHTTSRSTFWRMEMTTEGRDGAPRKTKKTLQKISDRSKAKGIVRRIEFSSEECSYEQSMEAGASCMHSKQGKPAGLGSLKRALRTREDKFQTPGNSMNGRKTMQGKGKLSASMSKRRKDQHGMRSMSKRGMIDAGTATDSDGEADGDENLLAISNLVSQALGDEDEDEGAGVDVAMLQQAMAKVIQSKRNNAKQKQRQIVEDVRCQIEESTMKLNAQIKREAAGLANAWHGGLEEIMARLDGAETAIDDVQSRLQADVAALKEELQDIHDQTGELNKDLNSAIEKKRSNLKRKVDQLKQEADEMLMAADVKIKKSKAQTAKLPELANLLKAFI